MPEPELKIELTGRQSLAWRLLTNLENIALLYGGAKGGGKSLLFCIWVDQWVQFLIEYFGIKPSSKHPPLPLGFIGRKRAVDFKKTTLETFKRIIPPDHYRIREQDGEIIFFNLVKVYYGGLDDQQTINKFNSAEFAFFAIDQAEETERGDVSVLQAALRLVVNKKTPPYKQLYTANPAECWLKEDFIDSKNPGMHFIPALHSDNPHLPLNYAETLTAAFKYNKPLLAAYLAGNWFSLKAENALLSAQNISDLKSVHHHPTQVRKCVVCDPSLGGDECCIKYFKNHKCEDMEILHERDAMKIAATMVLMAERHQCPNYGADVTGGLGSAILDRVRQMKKDAKTYYLDYSENATNEEAYSNFKMEMCWYYMQQVIEKRIPWPEDEETRRQLLGLRFKVINSQGTTQMEDKAKTKVRLGCSPDRGETEIMGIWVTDKTEPITYKDVWRDDDYSSSEIGGGAHSAMTA